MIRNLFFRFTCGFLTFCLILTTAGCIGDKVSYPIKVRKLPNTFKLRENWWGEKVIMVEVLDYSESLKTPVWRIKAIRDVPVRGFSITVGQAPEGFEQILPPPSESFCPTPGKKYGIAILTDVKSVFPVGTIWISE